MDVELTNTWAQVTAQSAVEQTWLTAYMTVDDPKFGVDYEGTFCMINRFSNKFPAGLLAPMIPAAKAEGFTVNVTDTRAKVCAIDLDTSNVDWLRDYQLTVVRNVCQRGGRGIIKAATGAGKCLGLGTMVLRFDGSSTPVENIQVGDLLMGPDSKPRTVLSTTTGHGELFRITPERGSSWVCNDVHVLTLLNVTTGAIDDVPLNEFLKKNAFAKRRLKLIIAAVDFPSIQGKLSVEPHTLGLWLGDDMDCGNLVTSLAIRLCLVDETNSLVPAYRCGTRETRRQLLAGYLDAAGEFIGANRPFTRARGEFRHRRRDVADDVTFIALSLGIHACVLPKDDATEMWCVQLCGKFADLPMKRGCSKGKKAGTVSALARRNSFKATSIGDGDYAGFTLDGDGRFLLGDFTVTHNTEIFIALTRVLSCEWLFLVHRSDLVGQTALRYHTRTKETAGTFDGGSWRKGTCNVTVASFQSVSAALRRDKKGKAQLKRGGGDVHALISATEAVFTDECHAAGGPGNYDVLQRLDNAYYRIGASGTPLNRKPKERMHIVGALGPIIAKVTTEELVKRKVLAQSVIRMIPVPQTGRSTSDWRGVYSELIVHSIKRNMALVHIAKEATKPSLLFVQELEHAENVMSLLALHGVKAESATGSDWNNTRVDKIARLVSGEFDVLVCTVIFQEGIDVPALASIIVGTGQMSPVACLQRLGRGIRISEGKTHFELWDVLDTGQKWLTKHSIARREAYESEGHTVTIGW